MSQKERRGILLRQIEDVRGHVNSTMSMDDSHLPRTNSIRMQQMQFAENFAIAGTSCRNDTGISSYLHQRKDNSGNLPIIDWIGGVGTKVSRIEERGFSPTHNRERSSMHGCGTEVINNGASSKLAKESMEDFLDASLVRETVMEGTTEEIWERDSMSGLPSKKGLSSAQVFGHSWRPINPTWCWVPRSGIHTKSSYPARPDEVCRLRLSAKSVSRVRQQSLEARSYAQVVREGRMAWRRDHGGSNWKRRQDEWMEEDDLLDGDPCREQDLRAKLQRGSGDSTDRIPAEQVRAMPNIRPAGSFGNWKKGQGGRGFAARGGFGG
jgi:hypothetical protein